MHRIKKLIQAKHKIVVKALVIILAFATAMPALADYLGPDRTVTETTSTCKIVLYECQFITSKNAWKYHKVDNWSCSNESFPWRAYPSTPSSQGCFDATVGDTYWSKEEVLQEVTVTHPPATIDQSLQNCNLNNGWCNTTPELILNGVEPLSGYDILAVEGSFNGQFFACQGSNCSVPLNEGNNVFNFWALSSWGDSSEMGSLTASVDTIPPTLGLGITASNGTNGWFVSQTYITATGSDATSGLSSVLLSANNGPWETSTTLNDGVHKVDVQAQDNAGNTSNTSSTISVDTTTPSIDLSINGATGNNGWYKSNIEITASATDATSGIDVFEVSSDDTAYVPYDAPITFADGYHTIRFKALDKAGNITETPAQEIIIDTIAPVVDIPTTWNVGESIVYKVQDDGSGLASLRIVIEDEDEKFAKVAWNENVAGEKFQSDITWDGIFKDGTTAPPGEYLVWVKASDIAGNESFTLGIVTVPSPFSTFQFISRTTSNISPQPPKELFDTKDNYDTEILHPTINFGGATSQVKETENTAISLSSRIQPITTATHPNSNVLWGPTAAIAISAIALYAQKEKEEREEEIVRRRTELEKRITKQEIRQKEAEQARKVAQWLEGQAILKAQKEAFRKQSLNNRIQQKENFLKTDTTPPSSKKSNEWKTAYTAYYQSEEKRNDLNAGMAAYYAASQGIDTPNAVDQSNWWEETKAFVKDDIIQPLNTSIYQPIVKPIALETKKSIEKSISEFNRNFYQPYVKPQIERGIAKIKDETIWLNENFYQPVVKPAIDSAKKAISNNITKINQIYYQPYIKPYVEKTLAVAVSSVAWANEKIYQPFIKPEIDQTIADFKIVAAWIGNTVFNPAKSAINEVMSPSISWITENIYAPIFSPIVNDINKYIYQPIADQVRRLWDRYGEWVHGSLDTVGFIPGLGEIADGINGLLYLGEGRYLEAGISAFAMIPLLGDLGKAGKWTVKAGAEVIEEATEKVVKEVVEEVAERVAKETGEELLEKTIKETAKEVSEKAIKETSEEVIEKVTKETIEGVGEETAEKLVKKTSEEVREKFIKDSLEETAEKTVTKTPKKLAVKATTEKISSKAIKESTRNIAYKTTDSILDKTSKEIKETLIEQALEKVDDKTAALVRSVSENLGDEVSTINKAIALIQKHGDDAVKALKAVKSEAVEKVLRTVDESILDDVIHQGSDAFTAFSSWTEKELRDHGKDLAARAAKDAEVLNDVKILVSKGPIDPKNLTGEQKLLIEKIAANSTFNADGPQAVIGKWVGLDGGFLKQARETGSLHYSPHPDLWELFDGLDNQSEVAWLINEQVIQAGIAKGLPFEYTLNNIHPDLIDNEHAAIKAIFSGKNEKIIKRKLNSDYLPVRMSELKELKKAGFNLKFDETINSYIIKK